MLVVTRKVGQELFIGNDITVTFVEQRDGAIRLGVDAPDDVLILRDDAGPEHSPSPEPEPEPEPESVSDVLLSLDERAIREEVRTKEEYRLNKHGPRQDPIDPYDPLKGE